MDLSFLLKSIVGTCHLDGNGYFECDSNCFQNSANCHYKQLFGNFRLIPRDLLFKQANKLLSISAQGANKDVLHLSMGNISSATRRINIQVYIF